MKMPAGHRRYPCQGKKSKKRGGNKLKIASMNGATESLQPIFTAHLFPKLEGMLIELLRSLTSQEWEKQTLAPKWKVKDVAAHLLDTQLRKLSICRDGHSLQAPQITSNAELVAFINSLNADGVKKYRQLNPE